MDKTNLCVPESASSRTIWTMENVEVGIMPRGVDLRDIKQVAKKSDIENFESVVHHTYLHPLKVGHFTTQSSLEVQKKHVH